jgi:hypothetical protein
MEKTEKLKTIVSCDVCRKYLVLHMEQPIRCGGIHYNEKGESLARDGTPWSEVIKENEEKRKKQRLEFYEQNKEHIDSHGFFK